jgi:hypothetical protein
LIGNNGWATLEAFPKPVNILSGLSGSFFSISNRIIFDEFNNSMLIQKTGHACVQRQRQYDLALNRFQTISNSESAINLSFASIQCKFFLQFMKNHASILYAAGHPSRKQS